MQIDAISAPTVVDLDVEGPNHTDSDFALARSVIAVPKNRVGELFLSKEWLEGGAFNATEESPSAPPCDISLSTGSNSVGVHDRVRNVSALVKHSRYTGEAGSDEHRPSGRFEVLQEWECKVKTRKGDSITAILCDICNPESEYEIAEFDIAEFNFYDRGLLLHGAVFYWVIGRLVSDRGQVTGMSKLHVRRFRKPSQIQRQASEKKAKLLIQALIDTNNDATCLEHS